MATSGWLDVLGRDLKFTRRVLTKNFAFTATAIVTLALGIAASTVIYSVVDAVLLKPLDYEDSGDIYRIYTVDPAGLPRGTTGPPHIDPMAEEGQSIQSAFYGYSFEQSVTNGEGTAFALNEFRTSEEFFQVFTEDLHLGRAFEPGDNFRNTVLSYQTWRDVFGSDPDIVGKPINVGSGPLTVIGVAAEGFEFPVGTAMWTKIFTGADGGSDRPLPLFNMPGYVRANPGVSAAQVQAELDVFAGRLSESFQWPDRRPLEFVAQPLLEEVVGDLRSTLWIVSGATAVLLLIACINVANLLLARGVVRSSEFALREALGARRWRVFRQLMTECFVLCTLGGVLGLGLALGAIQLLKAIGPEDLPRFGTLSIDTNVFWFAAACVVLVALVVGFAPAVRVSRGDLSALINSGGRSAAVAPGRNRIFGALVIAEIALAVVLVIGAGLLVRSYSQLASADPGFDPRRMVMLVLNVTGRFDVRNPRVDQEQRARRLRGNGHVGCGAVLPGAHAPHRGAARRRLRGRNVRCAAEPRAVPGDAGRPPRGRQRPPRHRSARVPQPSCAGILHDARHSSARRKAAGADRSARRGRCRRRQSNLRAHVSRWREPDRPASSRCRRRRAAGWSRVGPARRVRRRPRSRSSA